ncbi:cytoskeleton-associated protein 2-like isoform X2 [Panthera tigris]|uniref:cytoskeleton-associated protein 2-like isoform X2 n=1 Tax=Panthera leo TaxID=9689 RepID=UPI001C6A570F|nr:cytoskeleton-associated protein 2-like isoform X2 [Panthera leo]XP_042837923.1 cytoskeleton-associated protein 2-like isoform X2 [Panthera tigris]
MVPPRPSAAAEERQRKLQEYLAAKGKLKCQNTKPYLKAKNNCLNPPPSKSTNHSPFIPNLNMMLCPEMGMPTEYNVKGQ